MNERVLTVKQPWADLVMAGVKDVENRTWRVPSTLPQWWRCECGHRTKFPRGYTNPHHIHRNVGRTEVGMSPDGPFPFRLWIHAAAKEAAYNFADLRGLVVGTPYAKELIQAYHVQVSGAPRQGALLGTVEVTGCHHVRDCRDGLMADYGWRDQVHCSPWAEPDVYHWTLTDPQPLDEPTPMRGRQGLWTLEAVPA